MPRTDQKRSTICGAADSALMRLKTVQTAYAHGIAVMPLLAKGKRPSQIGWQFKASVDRQSTVVTAAEYHA